MNKGVKKGIIITFIGAVIGAIIIFVVKNIDKIKSKLRKGNN